MSDAPYALAVAAGMLAAVNPCGFVLLPAYVSLLVVGDSTGSPAGGRAQWHAVGRALGMTAAMTGGFVTVFASFGLAITPLALSVERHLPRVTIVIGLVLIGVGAWLLAGREIHIPGLRLRSGGPRLSAGTLVGYGASYAIASLSCTVAPFLALTTSTFRSSSLLAGLGVFVSYAVGMGLVVGAVTMGGALAGDTVAARLRRALPYVHRAGGLLLAATGAYVAYYGWYELRVFSGGATNDPVVGAAARIQGTVARWLDSLGAGGVVITLAILAAVTVGVTARRARRERAEAPEDVPTPMR